MGRLFAVDDDNWDEGGGLRVERRGPRAGLVCVCSLECDGRGAEGGAGCDGGRVER